MQCEVDEVLVSTGLLRLLTVLSAKLGPDDLLMQIAAVADHSEEPPLPLTLVLNNGAVVEGDVGSDAAMAAAADEPIREPIEDAFNAALARATPEDAPQIDLGVRMLGERGVAPWLSEIHDLRHAASGRQQNEGDPLGWDDLSEDDVLTLTEFAHRSAITLRNARLTLPNSEPVTLPIMRVSLAAVSC